MLKDLPEINRMPINNQTAVSDNTGVHIANTADSLIEEAQKLSQVQQNPYSQEAFKANLGIKDWAENNDPYSSYDMRLLQRMLKDKKQEAKEQAEERAAKQRQAHVDRIKGVFKEKKSEKELIRERMARLISSYRNPYETRQLTEKQLKILYG